MNMSVCLAEVPPRLKSVRFERIGSADKHHWFGIDRRDRFIDSGVESDPIPHRDHHLSFCVIVFKPFHRDVLSVLGHEADRKRHKQKQGEKSSHLSIVI